MDIMFANNFLTSIACHSAECLSWMIIVINILTVSYLVFCSFFKFGKTLKIIGFIWLILALAGIVAVIVLHTCVFTIICAVFTILILITAFAVILTHNEETTQKRNNYGSYVINPTTDGKFTFSFYDNNKHLVLQSGYTLNTVEEVNAAINLCRNRGIISKFEDHTTDWFSEKGYPKFELRKINNYYIYIFRCNSKTKVFQSKNYCHYDDCLKDVKKLMKIIKTTNVYYSTEVLSSEGKVDLVSEYLKPLS